MPPADLHEEIPLFRIDRVDRPPSVVVADWSTQSCEGLTRALVARGARVVGCHDRNTLRAALLADSVDILIAELRLVDGPTLDLIEWAKHTYPSLRIVIATSHASVATVVRCAKLGIDAYLSKPVTVDALLRVLADPDADLHDIPEEPMRLDRAVWEYIHRAVESAGSISRAADLIGMDRRSLRRMLTRYAPP